MTIIISFGGLSPKKGIGLKKFGSIISEHSNIQQQQTLVKRKQTEQIDQVINQTFETLTKNQTLKEYEPSNLEFNYDEREDDVQDPAQSRISSAQEEYRAKDLLSHQQANLKRYYRVSYYLLLNSLKTNPDFARSLIKPEFYIKNVLDTYYDNKETPILKERQVYKGKLISKVLPKNGIKNDKQSLLVNKNTLNYERKPHQINEYEEDDDKISRAKNTISLQRLITNKRNQESNSNFSSQGLTTVNRNTLSLKRFDQNQSQTKLNQLSNSTISMIYTNLLQTIIDENERDSRKKAREERNSKPIYLVEDGCDLSNCKMIQIDLNQFREKYDFQNQQNKVNRLQKYHLSLKQTDFEKRGFLEMLHYATLKLKKDKYHYEDNEINIHRNEYTHLFTLNGEEISNLHEIPEDVRVCVCSMGKNFKGVINSQKLVSFQDYKLGKDQNIKNHIYHKTQLWIRDKMLQWNQGNEKVDDLNKIIDLQHTNRIILPQTMNNATFQDQDKVTALNQSQLSHNDNKIPSISQTITQKAKSRSNSPTLSPGTKIYKTLQTQNQTQYGTVVQKQDQILGNNFRSHSVMKNESTSRIQQVQGESFSHNRSNDRDPYGTQDNQSKLPFLKFFGNARKQMLFLKADKIGQIERDKKVFHDKNQIDGEDIPEKYKVKQFKPKHRNIYDPDYGNDSEDFNDSENQDHYDEDYYFNNLGGRVYAHSFFSGTRNTRPENISQFAKGGAGPYGVNDNSSLSQNRNDFSFKSNVREHLMRAPQQKTSARNLLQNLAMSKTNTESQRKPTSSIITNSRTNMTQNTINYRKKAREVQYDQIKKFAEEFNVEEQQIYSLLSEYKGLYKIFKAQQEEDIENLVKKGAQNIRQRINENKMKIEVDNNLLIVGADELLGLNVQPLNRQQVPLKVYMKYSVFKRLLHHDVLSRILQAFGVDTASKTATISQRQFIGLNCFLRYQSMPKNVIVRTWIKILDPLGLGKIPRDQYMPFFEQLARGKLTLISTIVSSAFAEQLSQYMEQEGILNPDNKEILMPKLAQKLYDNEIDIELLSQTLRNIADLNIPDSKPITDFKFMSEIINEKQMEKKTSK
eukprot:403373116